MKKHEEWGTDGNGRVSQETAKGLLALVYLTRQDYKNALEYAEDVILMVIFLCILIIVNFMLHGIIIHVRICYLDIFLTNL